MTYLFYKNENRSGESTVIIISDTSDRVTTYPARTNYSNSRYDWLEYYRRRGDFSDRIIFKICENQFNKFKNDGTIPINWDW